MTKTGQEAMSVPQASLWLVPEHLLCVAAGGVAGRARRPVGHARRESRAGVPAGPREGVLLAADADHDDRDGLPITRWVNRGDLDSPLADATLRGMGNREILVTCRSLEDDGIRCRFASCSVEHRIVGPIMLVGPNEGRGAPCPHRQRVAGAVKRLSGGSWVIREDRLGRYMMPTVRVDGEAPLDAEEGRRLVLAIEDAGIDILHRCGGNARCTTCRVEVLEGDAGPMTEAEEARLATVSEVTDRTRLSCQIQVRDDLAVRVKNRLHERPELGDAGPRPIEWPKGHPLPPEA
ncbi:MAG TPA: 2Fe-2S iron-sulfur cluster-binding protein [Thermomicrobiales bacterium]|nr:2Fe-2S iron-sulfur cluster-binding protein [Thermomicrobiales bacterium]